MRRIVSIILIVMLVCVPAHAVRGQELSGPWRGVLDQAGGPLRFALSFEARESRW